MKKKENVFLAVLLSLLCVFLFIACDEPEGDNPTGKTPLSVPANVDIDPVDFTLKWNSVLGAAQYMVKINGDEIVVNTESYSLLHLVNNHGVYEIQVKAYAGQSNALFLDSAYSQVIYREPAAYVFEYESSNASPSILFSRNIIPSGLRILGLTAFGRTLEDIVIPNVINSIEVTVIGEAAFEDSIIISVEIPATVVSVGRNAFKGSSALREVTFNRSSFDGITSLDDGVFEGCAALDTINVPVGSEQAYLDEIIESTPELENQIDIPLPDLSGTVTILGNAVVGQTLTANTSALAGSLEISYQWERNGIEIGYEDYYIVTMDDVGYTITVTVTRVGFLGSRTSQPTAVVTLPVLTGTVEIEGDVEVGEWLWPEDYTNGIGDISYLWKRNGTVIGDDYYYNVTIADVGYTITVTITYSGNLGSVTSNPSIEVPEPDWPQLEGSVTIDLWSGSIVRVGSILNADTYYLEGSNYISYQWNRDGTPIVGANSYLYTLTENDFGAYITVTVTRFGYLGFKTSNTLGPVLDIAPVKFTIGYEWLAGDTQNLPGSNLNSFNIFTSSSDDSWTLYLDLPDRYESIEWFINGVSKDVGSDSFTVRSTDFTNTDAGTYILTIEVETLAGDFYNRSITFQVY